MMKTTSTLKDRIAMARKFLQGYTVKQLAAKYHLSDSTVAGYLRNHINIHGRVISKPPKHSKELQLPGEEWRAIPIHSAKLFEASSLGRIKSYAWKKPKIVQGNTKFGYRSIDYREKSTGKMRSELASVLICKTWHGRKPSPKHCVTHLDHDK